MTSEKRRNRCSGEQQTSDEEPAHFHFEICLPVRKLVGLQRGDLAQSNFRVTCFCSPRLGIYDVWQPLVSLINLIRSRRPLGAERASLTCRRDGTGACGAGVGGAGMPLYSPLEFEDGTFILLGIQWIAECQLDVAFVAGQGQPLSVVGGNEQSDDGCVLGFAGGGALQGVARCKHGDILQNCGCLLLASATRGFR